MVALHSSRSTLTPFDAGKLLGLAVKLLDSPANGTLLLCVDGGSLIEVIGDNVVRAVGRDRKPEQFHAVARRKRLQMNGYAVLLLGAGPGESLDAPVGIGPIGVVNQSVFLDWAVVNLAELLDLAHHRAGCIPAVHQHRLERKLFLVTEIAEHLLKVIDLAFAINVRVVDPVVDDPKLVGVRIDVNAAHNADAANYALRVTAPLPAHPADDCRMVFVQDRVVEDDVSIGRGVNLPSHRLPEKPGRDLFTGEVAPDHVVAPTPGVIGKVGERVVNLSAD